MELVSRPTGFLWGYVYVVLGVINAAANCLVVIQLFRAGGVWSGLAVALIVAIQLISVIGILLRRRWGLILTSILMALIMALNLWQVWEALFGVRKIPLIPGYLPAAVVIPVASFFYALFLFVYFVRRRKLFA